MTEFISVSEKNTIECGKKFARELNKGDIVGLSGELGTGKTQFAKGVAEYFCVDDIVNSPTFLIVNQYMAKLPDTQKEFNLFHFDLYRVKTTAELDVIGFNEYADDNSIILIEWPELAEKYLGREIRKIFFSYGKRKNDRIIKL
jgi:tRNA threonylcarbamoyladenosine biosynthesis protein TsaE